MKTIHLFAGPHDGSTLKVQANVGTLCNQGETYIHSAIWSHYLGRETFIHESYNGRPPKQEVAA